MTVCQELAPAVTVIHRGVLAAMVIYFNVALVRGKSFRNRHTPQLFWLIRDPYGNGDDSERGTITRIQASLNAIRQDRAVPVLIAE